jgi:single-stranded-DNA-specific exonuclease
MKPHILHGGGHKNAAGFSMDRRSVESFSRAFQEYLRQTTTQVDYERVVPVNLALQTLARVSEGDIRELTRLEPFGNGNPQPTFLLEAVIQDIKVTKNQASLTMNLTVGGTPLAAVAYGLGKKHGHLKAGDMVNVVANLGVNPWDEAIIQADIKHILPVR